MPCPRLSAALRSRPAGPQRTSDGSTPSNARTDPGDEDESTKQRCELRSLQHGSRPGRAARQAGEEHARSSTRGVALDGQPPSRSCWRFRRGTMKRIHGVELEDQAWFPAVFRNILTDSLQFGITKMGYYDRAAPLVRRLLQHAGTDRVLDMASGGTGPWMRLRGQLREGGGPDVSVTFTDKYASANARARIAALGDPRFTYLDEPVDATAVPEHLDGVRTMFTSFHHLRPEEARRVLEDAVQKRRHIGIFEFTERTPLGVAVNGLAPLAMWLSTPFIEPRTPARFLFTYVLPVAPLVNVWDGVVSALRTYNPEDLRALLPEDSHAHFDWEIGRMPPKGLSPPITYLLGFPRPTR